MSNLNLIPSPKIVLIQLFLFLIGFYIIKKFFVEPYMKQRQIRDLAIENSNFESDQLLAKNNEMLDFIDVSVKKVKDDIKKHRDLKIEESNLKANIILEKAKKECDEKFIMSDKQIDSVLSKEKKELDLYVKDIVKIFLNKI